MIIQYVVVERINGSPYVQTCETEVVNRKELFDRILQKKCNPENVESISILSVKE